CSLFRPNDVTLDAVVPPATARDTMKRSTAMKKLLALVMAASLGAAFSGTRASAQDRSTNPPAPTAQPAPANPSNPAPPATTPPPPPQAPPASSGSTSSTPATSPTTTSSLLVDANAVIGSAVRGADGKDIGKVSRLMLDPKTGRVNTVVIGMGGTLG